MTDYYETLYNSNDICGNYDLFNLKVKTIDKNEEIEANKPITLEEIGIVLSTFKNNESPGKDDIGIEKLKFFWTDLKYFLS